MPQASASLACDPISDIPEVERIAQAYLARCRNDPYRALTIAISDALADLCEAERRCGEKDRLISAGYVRRPLGGAR